jgi:hypothetical protein
VVPQQEITDQFGNDEILQKQSASLHKLINYETTRNGNRERLYQHDFVIDFHFMLATSNNAN